MVLDPDDPKPPYQQVANHLRAAILTGDYGPGERLPTGGQLAATYDVARMTVQKALQVLRDENLIISRQGSGVFVRERSTQPVGIRPHIEATFEADKVSIDFAGFSGETLHGALIEPLDKVRHGRYVPSSIQVRAIVPDTGVPWAVPCNSADLSDSPAFRERAQGIIRRHALAMVEAVEELESLGLVESATAEVRSIRSVQMFKLYVLNQNEVFFGFYPLQERKVRLNGGEEPIYDLMGKDATLFHHQRTDDESETESIYVDEAQAWFESLWGSIAQPLS